MIVHIIRLNLPNTFQFIQSSQIKLMYNFLWKHLFNKLEPVHLQI